MVCQVWTSRAGLAGIGASHILLGLCLTFLTSKTRIAMTPLPQGGWEDSGVALERVTLGTTSSPRLAPFNVRLFSQRKHRLLWEPVSGGPTLTDTLTKPCLPEAEATSCRVLQLYSLQGT